MKSCIYCGETLVPNPLHRHWYHCPVCESSWVEAIHRLNRLQQLHVLAALAVADTRGRPTRGGIKE